MSPYDFSPTAQLWVNAVLLWVGYGAAAGMLARGLFPGKEPNGPLSTFVIGALGSCAGIILLTEYGQFERLEFNPISPIGFSASLMGAIALLMLFRFCIYVYQTIQKSGHQPAPPAANVKLD